MTSSTSKIQLGPWKILLVDDHPVVLESLALRFSQEPDLQICGTSSSTSDALRAVEQYQPHLAILDMSLPDGHGLELIKDIHSRHPEVRMLVFSMHDENLYGERALRAGAQGYLMKHEPPEKVHDAVRRVLAGKMAVSDELAQRLLNNLTTPRPTQASGIERLSDRELEIFQLLGQGLGTKEIADRLTRSVKTVETYRQRIKEKLGIGSAPELVAKAAHWVAQNR